MHGRSEAPVLPFNRKYLGSKRQLREWLSLRMRERAGVPRTFLDGFCGTGSVSVEMARAGAERITAVDSLRSNCVILRGCAGTGGRVPALLDRLNGLAPVQGYISGSYAGTYFTAENCGRMDAIRDEMERLAHADEISAAEHDALLASFLLAADRVANTLGQYDAFLKNIAGAVMDGGRHLVDERVRTPFRMQPLEPLPGNVEVIEGDMVALAPSIHVDVAYFDPPYNHRQYCDNYHVLENLARWEKPPLFGKTRKFDRTGLKSPFSSRTDAASALAALADGARAGHVFLSYSSEGILSRDAIVAILSRRGETEVMEMSYPVFGNGAGVSTRRNVTEFLFHTTTGGA
jgi:adenine-specific DNA-methyltransferase